MQGQRRLRVISLNGQSVRANGSTINAPVVGEKKKSTTRVRKAVTDAFARQDRANLTHLGIVAAVRELKGPLDEFAVRHESEA